MLLGAAQIPPKGWRPFLGPATFPENKKNQRRDGEKYVARGKAKLGVGKQKEKQGKLVFAWPAERRSQVGHFRVTRQDISLRQLCCFYCPCRTLNSGRTFCQLRATKFAAHVLFLATKV